jgi:hypothetical protein
MALLGCGSDRSRAPGTPRSSSSDAGAGLSDAGRTDAGLADAGLADTGLTDADSGATDPDGGAPDAARDAGDPDIGTLDGGAGRGPCPTHIGFDRVGRSWTSKSTAAYEAQNNAQWTMQSNLTSIQDRGGFYEVQLTFTQAITAADYSSSSDGTIVYRCDTDGLWIVEQNSNSQTLTQGMVISSTSNVVYSPPLHTHIHSPTPGQSFSGQSLQASSGVSNGTPYNSSSSISHTTTVDGRQSITTPAGTFANAIQMTTDWGQGGTSQYYAEGVGFVSGPTSELVSYR